MFHLIIPYSPRTLPLSPPSEEGSCACKHTLYRKITFSKSTQVNICQTMSPITKTLPYRYSAQSPIHIMNNQVQSILNKRETPWSLMSSLYRQNDFLLQHPQDPYPRRQFHYTQLGESKHLALQGAFWVQKKTHLEY